MNTSKKNPIINNADNKLVLYTDKHGNVELRADVQRDTIWATQAQIARVFETTVQNIIIHLGNIFKEGELAKVATCKDFLQVQKEGNRAVKRSIEYYNLDAIIAVGYRVNSKQATKFRIWATGILRDYLVKGYAVNERRLSMAHERFDDLAKMVALMGSKSHRPSLKGKTEDILELLSAYSQTLSILERYDEGALNVPHGRVSALFKLSYENSRGLVAEVKQALSEKGEASDLFGAERGGAFEGVVKSIYQTWGGKELYPTVEDKSANLLYFTIKDHPFSDGNKRLGSILFLHFLRRNGALYRRDGTPKLDSNGMAALALLVAESDPTERETMVKLTKVLVG
jgi:prophage maintenance system killer protein